MGFKKDDSGRVPKSSFSSSLVFTPCPLFGVQFKVGAIFDREFIALKQYDIITAWS